MCSMGYRVCREYSTAVDMSLLVVECAMERALDLVGQRLTRCLCRHICRVKPATGRPYVRAFSLSGTVPAFTCDCLRFVCAFTPRPKVDLCVSTFSRTMLAFGNNVSFSSSACSTLAFCRQ